MIRSFADKRTAAVFADRRPKGFPTEILAPARKKLRIIDAAERLEDVNIPPGNRLEALRGDRDGQYSIRVKQQWRECFVWREDGPHDVEILDYH